MNLDIVSTEDGLDMGLAKTEVGKAGNVLSVQLGNLAYAPTFGVDLKYFLESPHQFQNESFLAYLVQRLTEHQVNVTSVLDVKEALHAKYTFYVGEFGNDAEGSLIR